MRVIRPEGLAPPEAFIVLSFEAKGDECAVEFGKGFRIGIVGSQPTKGKAVALAKDAGAAAFVVDGKGGVVWSPWPALTKTLQTPAKRWPALVAALRRAQERATGV